MPIVLDETTRAAYLAESLASSRAALVVSALTGIVSVEVRDGSDVLRASGTMSAPWATSSGATITVGQVTGAGIDVTSGGTPDANWYCQFRSGARFVRGTFGVLGSGRDFVWSLASFLTGSRGTIGAVQISVTGQEPVAGLLVNPVISVQRATANETIYQIVTPGEWTGDMPTFASGARYPIVRRFYWQADGVDIPRALGTTFSPGRAQAGKSIRVREAVWFVATPNEVSNSYSNAFTAPSSLAADVVYHDDIVWEGAFRVPNVAGASSTQQTFAYGGWGLSYDPSGNFGAGSLFIMGHINTATCGEISIPAVTTTELNFGSLPRAQLLQYTANVLNGRELNSGAPYVPGGWRCLSVFPDGAGKLLLSYHNQYPSNADGQGAEAYFFRRSRTLTDTSEIEGPFRVTAPTRDHSRTANGYMSKVPAALQASLGGTHIVGLIPDSGGAYPLSSCGPSIHSVNLSAFDGTKAFRFDVVSATLNTVRLPNTANSTNGFYVGHRVQTLNPNYLSRPMVVTAYDGPSRTATISGNWSVVPSAGHKAQMVCQVPANALANYDALPFGNNVNGWNLLNRVWDNSVSTANVIIPPGTRSAIVVGAQGNGIWQYTNNTALWQSQLGTLTISNVVAVSAERWTCTISGISGSLLSNHVIVQGSNIFYQVGNSGSTYTLNVFRGDGHQGQFGTQGPVVGSYGAPVSGGAIFTQNYTWPFNAYDPVGESTGEHAFPYHLQLNTHNTDDLAAVRANALPLQSLRPSQRFNFTLPVANPTDSAFAAGAAYDSANRRLFVAVWGSSGGETAIHVFRINNAVPE